MTGSERSLNSEKLLQVIVAMQGCYYAMWLASHVTKYSIVYTMAIVLYSHGCLSWQTCAMVVYMTDTCNNPLSTKEPLFHTAMVVCHDRHCLEYFYCLYGYGQNVIVYKTAIVLYSHGCLSWQTWKIFHCLHSGHCSIQPLLSVMADMCNNPLSTKEPLL